VVITNYEAVRDYEFSFAYFPEGKSLWSIVVTDEAQEYKTPNSKISHAMKALRPDFRIACTGTPVENRLLDLWNLFDTVQPGLLGSAREFTSKYESNGPGSVEELKERLLYGLPHAFLLRRNKEDVLDLPPKIEKDLICQMTVDELAVHRRLSGGIASTVKPKGRLDLLGRFARASQHPVLLESDGDASSVQELKQKSSKLQEVLTLLHQVQRQKEKVLIFARHKDVQRMLARVLSEEFRRPVRIINGDTARSGSSAKLGSETRRSILKAFQESPGFAVVILSPFVAGVGLTIVEANHVIHYGRWWNPAVESQATDRAYRLGQTKPVNVYYPILVNPTDPSEPTFDQALAKLMAEKKSLATGLLTPGRFLEPQPPEEALGLQVLSNLQTPNDR